MGRLFETAGYLFPHSSFCTSFYLPEFTVGAPLLFRPGTNWLIVRLGSPVLEKYICKVLVIAFKSEKSWARFCETL